MTSELRLCRLDEIPDGTSRSFTAPPPESIPFFVVRRGDRVYGYRDRCPHELSPLAWRRDEYLSPDKERIVCFGHGAEFEIATGRCLSGPCVGQSLVKVPVRVVNGEDVMLAELLNEE